MKNSNNDDVFRDTKICRLYDSLDEYQRKRFRDFIQSPYHNPAKKLIRFWAVFERFYNRANKKLTLVDFYKKLHPKRFPQGKLSEKQREAIINKVRKLNTEIWQLLREFIGLEIYHSQPLLKEKHIYEGFSNFEPIGGHMDFKFSNIESRVEETNIHPYTLLLKHQLWSDKVYEQYTEQNQPITADFEKAVATLDEYYFTKRIFYELESLTLNRQFSQHSKQTSIDSILPFWETQIDTLNPLARGGYYLYQALTGSAKKESTEILFSIIEESYEKINKIALRNLATGAINLMISLRNTYLTDEHKKLHDNYIKALEKEWICIDGQLEVRHFNNLITLLLQAGDVDRAEVIFHKWGKRLMTKVPEIARSFNHGKILLEKYDLMDDLENVERLEILELARKSLLKVYHEYTRQDDFLFDFNARLLMIRVYYLQEKWDDIEGNYTRDLSYMKKHPKCSKIRQEAGMNFIKMVSRLYKLRIAISFNNEDVRNLEQTIKKEPRLSMKPWLLKQLKMLYS